MFGYIFDLRYWKISACMKGCVVLSQPPTKKKSKAQSESKPWDCGGIPWSWSVFTWVFEVSLGLEWVKSAVGSVRDQHVTCCEAEWSDGSGHFGSLCGCYFYCLLTSSCALLYKPSCGHRETNM